MNPLQAVLLHCDATHNLYASGAAAIGTAQVGSFREFDLFLLVGSACNCYHVKRLAIDIFFWAFAYFEF